MPILNEPLIREAVAYIREHPEAWAQDVYEYRTACGTQRCLAGTLLALHYDTDAILSVFGGAVATVDVGGAARIVAGLDYEQAERLFYSTIGMVDLEEFVKVIEKETGLDLSPERITETEGE